MLLRINIFTFSRAVPKKSAIKLCYWASQFCPFPPKQGMFSISLTSHVTCDKPFAFATEKPQLTTTLTLLFQQQKKQHTIQNVFKLSHRHISYIPNERLMGRNTLTHSQDRISFCITTLQIKNSSPLSEHPTAHNREGEEYRRFRSRQEKKSSTLRQETG